MSRPKIVKETKRAQKERRPPLGDAILPHEWLSDESLLEYNEVVNSTRPFEAYISRSAERRMREHSIEGARGGIEVMGFLMGEVYAWKGDSYVLVRDIGTTELRSSPSKVRFDPDAFPALFKKLDSAGFDYVLVGWYHSHPGHTCFMSRTDLETQRTIFREKFHVAIVIDPLNEEVKAFKLAGSGYREVPFAVDLGECDSGSQATSTRKRKLKPTSQLG